MKERPILFSAPMVRALLAGTKTQTRRIAKPVKHPDLGNVYDPGALVLEREPQHVIERASPYGQPGDRLLVREAWKTSSAHNTLAPRDIPPGDAVEYAADPERILTGKLRPSMFMPRWASRITLEITSIRVERLWDISASDALAEGITHRTMNDPRVEYHHLWEDINGAESWDANPWVWVVEFKRVEGSAA